MKLRQQKDINLTGGEIFLASRTEKRTGKKKCEKLIPPSITELTFILGAPLTC